MPRLSYWVQGFFAEEDIDERCFARALDRFLAGGAKEDAFDLYFCFAEIFNVFGRGYTKNVKPMVELLASFEQTSGVLLDKHRDHYAHSAYVFALGLALYLHNPALRACFAAQGTAERRDFLLEWGCAALFHDVGYPFELVFEMVKGVAKDGAPALTYGRLAEFNGPTAADRRILAHALGRLGVAEEGRLEALRGRITDNPKFMDHGYFGAVMLYQKLADTVPEQVKLDVAGAVLLHNSYYKHDLLKKGCPPLDCARYPLAWLLMLCDDLQCWDRTPYGRSSKEKPIAWDVEADLGRGLSLCYLYEREGAATAVETNATLAAELSSRLKLKDVLPQFSVRAEFARDGRPPKRYMSVNHLQKLTEIALAIHEKYLAEGQRLDTYVVIESWDALTLEYKLSNILQAKSYAEKLDRIGCFYDDRLLAYPVKECFSERELEILARAEHDRWAQERLSMGWRYGELRGETKQERRADRETRRVHPSLIAYDDMPDTEKQKDRVLIAEMIDFLRRYADIRIYQLTPDRTPVRFVALTGHRNLHPDCVAEVEKSLQRELKAIQALGFRVRLWCGFADGADLIGVRAAVALGIPVEAVLPRPLDEYRREVTEPDFDELLEKAAGVFAVPALTPDVYDNAGRCLVNSADELIAVWDGKALPLEEDGFPVNRGGTYHLITLAGARGIPVRVVSARRREEDK